MPGVGNIWKVYFPKILVAAKFILCGKVPLAASCQASKGKKEWLHVEEACV